MRNATASFGLDQVCVSFNLVSAERSAESRTYVLGVQMICEWDLLNNHFNIEQSIGRDILAYKLNQFAIKFSNLAWSSFKLICQ